MQLQTFCDSDWVGYVDDRKSTTGFAIFLRPFLVSWSVMALVNTKLFWICMLLKDLHIFSPQVLWSTDNLGDIALASNPIFHARTNHIEIDYHFIK